MRLWSLHPQHLDGKGLVALWREGLLARAVLAGQTVGYRHHPQLIRFRALPEPLRALDGYLSRVFDEASSRGYRFDRTKINYQAGCHSLIFVSTGQLAHEWEHLLLKLKRRAPSKWQQEQDNRPSPHPCFAVLDGPMAEWEKVK